MSIDSWVGAARFQWEDGLRDLDRDDGLREPRRRIVDAVHVELRRKLGQTFTLAELSAAYAGASDWYLDLAARTAPRHPEAWDPAVALDGAFALYARGATDART